jgi:topoisomerase IV subunit A
MARKKVTRKRTKTKVEAKVKTIQLPISKLIDTKFRDYAVYVLEQRGIPSFYDGLTPVQRYILMNSPTAFSKTLSVVGKSIEDGYHHGDMSLSKAISKLARPFGSSIQILEGYGFFGSEVSPEPAAARYTSIKISSKAAEILKKYKYLTSRNEDGAYDPFWLDVPLGLTTGIIGIAVGYKSTVLPRKLEDIREYFEGKRKSVKPYFHDFSGSIHKYNGLDKSWIISSEVKVDGNRIEIRELPPVMKYASILKKLDWLFGKFEGKVKVINNSNTKVNIDIVYMGKSAEEWKEIQEFAHKTFSIIVTETPVFIKDGQVLVYDKVEEYLDDYKWQLLRLDFKDKEYQRNWTSDELDFNRAKKLFINFMLQVKRTVAEIDEFTKDYTAEIKDRLENLNSKKFTKDELAKTTERIKELEISLRSCEKALKESQKLFESTLDPTQKRGITSRKTSIDLLEGEDMSEVNGIEIWDGEDPYENGIEQEEIDE